MTLIEWSVSFFSEYSNVLATLRAEVMQTSKNFGTEVVPRAWSALGLNKIVRRKVNC